MTIDSRLFKALVPGLGRRAALLLADTASEYTLGPRAPITTYKAMTAADGDVILANATSRAPTDGVTTNLSATVSSATAAFVSTDVGKTITGTGIPASTTILSVTSSTVAVLSAACTATATGITFTIGGAFTVTGPAAAAGARFTVLRLNAANTVTIDPPGNVNGAATLALGAQYAKATLVCDGTNWFQVV
jgi:hypothetical protein